MSVQKFNQLSKQESEKDHENAKNMFVINKIIRRIDFRSNFTMLYVLFDYWKPNNTAEKQRHIIQYFINTYFHQVEKSTKHKSANNIPK